MGLDHIPVAVKDLDGAVRQYKRMGFAIKPGRLHANDIRNQHIKFPDGTELELITATESKDPLASVYVRHLLRGDGPAFVGFYVPQLDSVAHFFAASERVYQRAGRLITFPENMLLHYMFFGPRNKTATDRPEHFHHVNGAMSLIGVWLSGQSFENERQLLSDLGASIQAKEVHVPDRITVLVATLLQGEVLFLPPKYQQIPGRRIVGATLLTDDIETVRRTLADSLSFTPKVVYTSSSSHLYLPPDKTFGIWLEFRHCY